MPLIKLINDIYPDGDVAKLNALIEKHNLQHVLKSAIEKIEGIKPSLQDPNNLENLNSHLSGISSAFLVGVNARLAAIREPGEKSQVELLISDIAFELLKQVLQHYKGNKEKLLRQVNNSLSTACDLNGYNYNSLQQLFPLNKFISIQSIESNAHTTIVYTPNPIYYQWNSMDHNLDELARTLKSKGIIQSLKEFKSLFKPPVDSLKVRFNKEQLETVIVLFDLLYSKDLIVPKGNKGHFMPLRIYAVDFENKILINEEPKSIKYTIKKNKAKWQLQQATVEKWVTGFETK